MTEMAMTGLSVSVLADYVRPAGQRTEQNAAETSRREQVRRERTAREEAPRETERVVSGEVVPADDNTYQAINTRQARTVSTDTAANSNSNSNSQQARRFSMQAAVQTYTDNQALGDNQNRAVQVSGIIDEYV